ncbi:MAG: peptidase M48, partial [Ginsengibacter sp.]
NFIRAKAIDLWSKKNKDAEEEIIKMIEGVAQLDQLDIFKQEELAKFTKNFLQLYLKPKWFQTSMVIGLAKQYFADFSWKEDAVIIPKIIEEVTNAHNSVKDYLGYILLDFCLLDPTLEEIPMGWAFQFSEDVQLKEVFNDIVKKELKYSDKKLQQHKAKMLAAYYEVKESEVEQIYEG